MVKTFKNSGRLAIRYEADTRTKKPVLRIMRKLSNSAVFYRSSDEDSNAFVLDAGWPADIDSLWEQVDEAALINLGVTSLEGVPLEVPKDPSQSELVHMLDLMNNGLKELAYGDTINSADKFYDVQSILAGLVNK